MDVCVCVLWVCGPLTQAEGVNAGSSLAAQTLAHPKQHTHGSTHRNTRKPTPFIVRCGGDLHAKGESTGFMYLSGWRGQL